MNDRPVNTAAPGLSARKVVQILDKAEQAVAIGRTNDGQIHSKYSSSELAITDRHELVGGSFDVRSGIARMQAIATQPAYFRRPLTPEELESAAPLVGQFDASRLDRLGQFDTSRLDRQVLAPIVDLYADKLDRTPLPQRPQVAAQCIAACIDAGNRHTIRTGLEDRAAGPIYGSGSAGGSPPSHEAEAATAEGSLIALLCADMLSPEAPLLTPEAVLAAAEELDGVRSTLRAELPNEIRDERIIDDALASLSKGQSTLTSSKLLELARHRILHKEFTRRFDMTEQESDLCNIVVEAAHGRKVDTNTTALLGAIAKEMLNEVEERAASVPEEHKCAPDLRTVFPIMHEALIRKTKEAAAGHFDALEAIEKSTTLNVKQKALLRGYAEGGLMTYNDGVETPGSPPHRLDAVQLRHFEITADTIAAQILVMRQAAGNGEPAQLFDSMVRIEADYSSGLKTILDHAATLWVSQSVFGMDKDQELFDLCVQLALVRQDDADLHDLGSPAVAAESSEVPAHDPRHQGPADTVRQFRDACAQSSMGVDKLGRYYGDILRVAGVEPAADRQVDVGAAPPERQPLYLMRPELLARTLGHPSCTEEDMFDPRGALSYSAAASRVRPDFDPKTSLRPEDYEVSLAERDLSASSTRDMVSRALGAADIVVNGRRLSLDTDSADSADKIHALADAFVDEFSREYRGADLAAAASLCMSSDTLERFSDAVDVAAFDPPMVQAQRRPVYEVWRGEDGNWRVRSTRVSSPLLRPARVNPPPRKPGGTPGVQTRRSHSLHPHAFHLLRRRTYRRAARRSRGFACRVCILTTEHHHAGT